MLITSGNAQNFFHRKGAKPAKWRKQIILISNAFIKKTQHFFALLRGLCAFAVKRNPDNTNILTLTINSCWKIQKKCRILHPF